MTPAGIASELDRAERSTRELGQLVVEAIHEATTALRTQDRPLAERVIRNDAAIDRKRYAVEEEAVGIIATREAAARDPRLLVAILNVVVDLERTADHAAGIAQIVLRFGDRPPAKLPAEVERMAEIAASMLEESLTALLTRDVEAARRVVERDGEVHALMERVYPSLIHVMLRLPSGADRSMHLIRAAHDLERIADRATSICERVACLVTGHTREIDVSRY